MLHIQTRFILFVILIIFTIYITQTNSIPLKTLAHNTISEVEHITLPPPIFIQEKQYSDKNSYDLLTTTNELKKILEQLYQNDYILINTNELLSPKPTIPLNKKPIIISFENPTHNINKTNKIILDRNNNLALYSSDRNIQNRISYDNNYIFILENFISKHPDFSHNNAKATILSSGYNGILGYNTNHKNASHKNEQKKVAQVIKKLEQLGWEFGYNDYNHQHPQNQSEIDFIKNISLWQKEIGKLITNPTIYANPILNNTPLIEESKLKILSDYNFSILFDNNTSDTTVTNNNYQTVTNRKFICGKTLRNNQELFQHLFTPSLVYDHNLRSTPFSKIEI